MEKDRSQEVFLAVCVLAAVFSVFARRPAGLPFATLGVFKYFYDHFDEYFDPAILGALAMMIVGVASVLIATLWSAWWRDDAAGWRRVLEAIRPRQRDDPVTFGF